MSSQNLSSHDNWSSKEVLLSWNRHPNVVLNGGKAVASDRSRKKLLGDDAFFQIMFRIEQQIDADRAVLFDVDGGHIAELGKVGDRRNRAFDLFQHLNGDDSLMRQK